MARGGSPEWDLVLAMVRATARPDAERQEHVRRFARAAGPDAVLTLLTHLGVTTRLGRLLLDDDRIELPAHVEEALRQQRRLARHRGLMQHGLTASLVRALGSEGIPAAPLKGVALAEAVFGDLGARESTDIDLLVPVEQLGQAVEVAVGEGWHQPEWALPADRLPRLHHELFHAANPPLERHWRVHWYETAYAQEALARARDAPDGWRQLLPADELCFLLLFLARDGFAGLRQTVDVAAWWGTIGSATTAAEIEAIAARHPALAPALTAAARHTERLADLPPGSLSSRALATRQRLALRLANPWLRGSREQIDATVSLIDGLLSPPRGLPAFARRQLFPPNEMLVRRNPKLAQASRTRRGAARAGHTFRLLPRYVVAGGRLVAGSPT